MGAESTPAVGRRLTVEKSPLKSGDLEQARSQKSHELGPRIHGNTTSLQEADGVKSANTTTLSSHQPQSSDVATSAQIGQSESLNKPLSSNRRLSNVASADAPLTHVTKSAFLNNPEIQVIMDTADAVKSTCAAATQANILVAQVEVADEFSPPVQTATNVGIQVSGEPTRFADVNVGIQVSNEPTRFAADVNVGVQVSNEPTRFADVNVGIQVSDELTKFADVQTSMAEVALAKIKPVAGSQDGDNRERPAKRSRPRKWVSMGKWILVQI